MSQGQRNLVEKIETLGSNERAELERFLDSLIQRVQDGRTTRVAAAMSEPVFEAVWSNPEDDVYDAL